MTTPATPMTPERWRAIDAILQAALACEPARRDAFVAQACGADAVLRADVTSLLHAHDAAGDEDFLEQPAVAALGLARPPAPERLDAALAGRYVVEREIARGGMATVYLARDVRHARRVALKVMRDEIAAAVGAERFLEEIRVTASLQHPHVLPLFDSGSADGLLWYTMPFADGETLRSRLTRDGPLPIDEAVRLAREIADALDHAHARGIVHRDIKPENILLQGGHALVADFGIALALERAGGDRLTRTGLSLGTPQYMAPEQAMGEPRVDARADVYALGAVLHEMIAGTPPFAAPSRQAAVQRMLHAAPHALSVHRPGVPPALDAAVQRALAKRPDARFQSVPEFANAIAAAMHPAPNVPPNVPPHGPLHGPPHGPPHASSGRVVGARFVIYATLVALVIGVFGGWLISRSALVARVSSAAPALLPQPTINRGAGGPANAGPPDGGSVLEVVDREGQPVRTLAANRPWTPRFSPDGHRLAYGAFGDGRESSDLWIANLDDGTTTRLTNDDADSNDPQWSANGASLAYSANAPNGKDVMARRLNGTGSRIVATRHGVQFPSDWTHDGRALLVTEDAGANRRDILVQPINGEPARAYLATAADETAAHMAPNGKWIAYTSDATGRAEVYIDAYSKPGHPMQVSQSGGYHPVWRADGRELFYWRDDALVAVSLAPSTGKAPPEVLSSRVLFHARYQGGLNTMYDVSPDGQRFAIVRRR